MKYLTLLAALIALGAAAGCASSGGEVVTLRDEPVAAAQQRARDPNAPLADLLPQEEPGTRYISAANAASCPKVKVSTAQGTTLSRQLSESGCVTAVVFASMDQRQSLALLAQLNAWDVLYRTVGLRCIAVIQRTRSAGEAEQFATSLGISFPVYYDDLSQSALARMSKAAGAAETSAVPSVLIVDRHGRLRFYRPGFQYTASGPIAPNGRARTIIEEIAPAGRAVKDYLEKLLREP